MSTGGRGHNNHTHSWKINSSDIFTKELQDGTHFPQLRGTFLASKMAFLKSCLALTPSGDTVVPQHDPLGPNCLPHSTAAHCRLSPTTPLSQHLHGVLTTTSSLLQSTTLRTLSRLIAFDLTMTGALSVTNPDYLESTTSQSSQASQILPHPVATIN